MITLQRDRTTSGAPGHRAASPLGAPRIRPARFEDHSEIAALQAKYNIPAKTRDEWCHLWIHNPAYLKFQDRLPIGWVLESAADGIVGYLGNIPLFYTFQGERLLAAVAHAWVVDERYRTLSLLLLDSYFSQRIVDLFLNATVGPNSVAAFSVSQSEPVPVGQWDRSVFWITNYSTFFAGWLASKNVPCAALLGRFAGPCEAIALRSGMRGRRPGGADLEECKIIDQRFDRFWAALERTKPDMLFAVRSREVLSWHFQHAIECNRAWILTHSVGNELVAYGVFFRHDNDRYGLTRVRLVDFQALDGGTSLLAPMLNWALERCRRERIGMLESIGFCPGKRDVIVSVAPHERKLPSWLYYYKARDRRLAEKLAAPSVWDPCQFDGDASL